MEVIAMMGVHFGGLSLSILSLVWRLIHGFEADRYLSERHPGLTSHSDETIVSLAGTLKLSLTLGRCFFGFQEWKRTWMKCPNNFQCRDVHNLSFRYSCEKAFEVEDVEVRSSLCCLRYCYRHMSPWVTAHGLCSVLISS